MFKITCTIIKLLSDPHVVCTPVLYILFFVKQSHKLHLGSDTQSE